MCQSDAGLATLFHLEAIQFGTCSRVLEERSSPHESTDLEVTHVSLFHWPIHSPISLAINNHMTIIYLQRRLQKIEEPLDIWRVLNVSAMYLGFGWNINKGHSGFSS